jgi:putative transposase
MFQARQHRCGAPDQRQATWAAYLREVEFRWNHRGAFEGRLGKLFGSSAGPLPLKGVVRMKKRHGALRADALGVLANPGKERKVLRFVADYRRLSVALGRVQWRRLFEHGATDKYAPAKHLNVICGAAPVQMASFQVQEQIDSWLGCRANDFIDRVRHSTVPESVRHQLYRVNRRGAWFSREPLDKIGPEIRALARAIMRDCMKGHRRPDLSHLSPRLDVRVARFETPKHARLADYWVRLGLPNRGRVALPVRTNPLFERRKGKLCPVVQLCTNNSRLSLRLVHDMAEPFAASRAAYEPKTDRISIDFGLATLIATNRGDLMGRGLMADLVRIDRQLVAIARHRMRAGSTTSMTRSPASASPSRSLRTAGSAASPSSSGQRSATL